MQQEVAMRDDQTDVVSDFAIASAVAQAVRATPGVVDLSADAEVTTYGSGQRVNGVIVHHPAPDDLALEIHVALGEAESKLSVARTAPGSDGGSWGASGLLNEVASRIRGAVYDMAPSMAPRIIRRVDVYIDDLR